MDNKIVVNTLNNLLETCRESLDEFKEASQNVKNPDFKKALDQLANERAQFVQELQREVGKLGGEAQQPDPTAGVPPRAWRDLKGTLSGKDDHSIMVACERGEDSGVSAYRNAIKQTNLPATVLTIINRQLQSVQQGHDRIKQLRDAKAASSAR